MRYWFKIEQKSKKYFVKRQATKSECFFRNEFAWIVWSDAVWFPDPFFTTRVKWYEWRLVFFSVSWPKINWLSAWVPVKLHAPNALWSFFVFIWFSVRYVNFFYVSVRYVNFFYVSKYSKVLSFFNLFSCIFVYFLEKFELVFLSSK